MTKSGPPSEQALLAMFLDALMKLENVDRGSIWVKRQGLYQCIEARGEQCERVQGMEIPADQPSIVGWTIEHKQRTLSRPENDERHFAGAEQGLDTKSRLILCFPMILYDGRVYGAIQLIDTTTSGTQIDLKSETLELIENLVQIGTVALGNFLEYRQERNRTKALHARVDQLEREYTILGRSRTFLDALDRVHEYARADYPVLIIGESGAGKELFARELHRLSARRDGPFLAQNCSAIPETLLESELFGHTKGAFSGAWRDKAGLFESATGGTVFLDEIGDMPLGLQARILRAVQSREVKPLGSSEARQVDVRIVAATHVHLEEAVQAGHFREDLFYRLNVLPVRIPPLRERRDDISMLLEFFVGRECHRLGVLPKQFLPEALDCLVQHDWKGNVRELENLVRRIVVLSKRDTVGLSDLPAHIARKPVHALSRPPATQGAGATPASRGDNRKTADQVSAEGSRFGATQGAGLAGKSQDSTTQEDTGPPQPEAPQASDLINPCGELDALTWEKLERRYVEHLLAHNCWNVSECARQAGLNRTTFHSRMRRLGIRKRKAGKAD